MTKTAVCFIGTSEYINFFPDWKQSCELNLFPGVEKTYMVFTDAPVSSEDNVLVYPIEHLKWPYITLYRFMYIKRAFSEIKKHDYFLFLDADCIVKTQVLHNEIFDPELPYTGVAHPYQPHSSFEWRSESRACMQGQNTSVYFQGCLWGGKTHNWIEDAIEELNNRIHEDQDNYIMAQFHDESHLNRFYSERRNLVKVLPSQFAYPGDSADYPGPVRILHGFKDNDHFHNL